MACLFWQRLRARGYTTAFLRSTFAAAPTYAQRDALLAPKQPLAAQARNHVLTLDYSASLASAPLTRALYEFRHLLPAHLRTDFIVAWRVPRKLAALLVPFRFALPSSPPLTGGVAP